MRNAAEPVRAAGEPAESGRAVKSGKDAAPSRQTSEGATLVCAITVAVSLGIACGAWINASLVSASSIATPAPAYLLPTAPAREPAPTNDAETVPVVSKETELAAAEDASADDSDRALEERDTRLSPPAEKEREKPAAVAVRHRAGEANPSGKSRVESPTAGVAAAKPRDARGQARAAQCALYASADSLNIRGGGAASLVVGGPGEAGRVSVTTPDWSNIAVFSEGRTGGNGWVRYSVRSVGKKAGIYSVRFTTPCGTRNIPVTVTRP